MNETTLTTEPAERTARRISSDWLALAQDLQKWNGKGSARHQRFLERFQQLQNLFDQFAEEVRGLDAQQRRSLRQTRESVGQCYREFCELRDLFSKEHPEPEEESFQETPEEESETQQTLSSLSSKPPDKRTATKQAQLRADLSKLRQESLRLDWQIPRNQQISRFRHERTLDREMMEALRPDGKKVPSSPKRVNQLSQQMLKEKRSSLEKKYGTVSPKGYTKVRQRTERFEPYIWHPKAWNY